VGKVLKMCGEDEVYKNNYRMIESDCCAKCKHIEIEWDGVRFCTLFGYSLIQEYYVFDKFEEEKEENLEG